MADFNGDGTPDVLEQGTGTLLVMLGNGDGTFQAPISTNSAASLATVAAADLNGDGKADVVGVFNNALLVYLSNGDGTFQPGVSQNLPVSVSSGSPIVISFGDFNGDAKTDVGLSLKVASGGEEDEIVFLGNGDGTFQTAKISPGVAVFNLFAAVVGDFNGDGKSDLIIDASNADNTGLVDYLLLGKGDGTFQTPTSVVSAAVQNGGGSLAVADVNGDGKLDLVALHDPTVAQVYFGNGDGTFSSPHNYILNSQSSGSGISLADINSDKKLDIIGSGSILLGNGDGTFQGWPLAVVPNGVTVVATGVFNNKDGFVDVAGLDLQTNLYILHNDGTGVLNLTQTFNLPGEEAIVSADLNGDGKLDLAVASFDQDTSTWGYSILLGNGDGTFQSPVSFPGGSSQAGPGIIVADFNNDHIPDLAFSPAGNDSLAVLIGKGDGTFAAPAYYFNASDNASGRASEFVAADFNGDGNLDIASGGTGGTPPAILFGKGDGTFQAATFPVNLNGFLPMFTADVNHDGKADLVGGGDIALGDGHGTFNLLPPGAPLGIAVSDFNGDGKLDFFDLSFGGLSGLAFAGVQLGNGDGTFGPVIPVLTSVGVFFSTQGTSYRLGAIADMNGDARPDLIITWPHLLAGAGVVLNNTASGFSLSASALSPSPIPAGNSASSTVTIGPTFGFNGSVALACAGLPSGASCAFNPAIIPNSSGTSTLTLTTGASVAAGTYSIQVQGSSGSVVNSAPLGFVLQAPADFIMSAAPTSQTISAGKSASFTLSFAGTGSFSGTVSLACAITPPVTPAPTCNLSSSSVAISGSGAQTVTVNVGTTAPETTSAGSTVVWPSGPMWSIFILSGFACLLARSRKRLSSLAAPILFTAVALSVSCGGSSAGSSSTHTTPGTPAGTYTATVTATSGSLSHNTAFEVTVH